MERKVIEMNVQGRRKRDRRTKTRKELGGKEDFRLSVGAAKIE